MKVPPVPAAFAEPGAFLFSNGYLNKPSPWGEGAPVRTLGRMRGQILDWVRYTQREFRRLRAASYFARGGKVTKTPPGTAPDEHFVLIVAYPTPSVASRHRPLTGGVGPGPR